MRVARNNVTRCAQRTPYRRSRRQVHGSAFGRLTASRRRIRRPQKTGTRNVVTRSAQRTCTTDAGRSEVCRTVPHPLCSSGQIRNGHLGHARQNTCTQAAARNKSGRRTPPLRAVSRATSPFPPTGFKFGGVAGIGGSGERGGGGVRGFAGCVPGGAPGRPLRVAVPMVVILRIMVDGL